MAGFGIFDRDLIQLEGAGGGNVTVTPTTAALTLSAFAPTIKHQIVVPVKALTLTTFAPVIKHSIIVPVKALTLAMFAPTVTTTANQVVTPTTVALTTTLFAPVIKWAVIVPTKALTLATFAPTVTVSAAVVVTPGTAALVLTKFVPVVTASDHKTVTPTTASLFMATFAPTVTVAAGSATVEPITATLTLTTFAPTVTVTAPTPTGGLGRAWRPPSKQAKPKAIKVKFKRLPVPVTVYPLPAHLKITTYPPTVTVTDNKIVTPITARLSIVTFPPVVIVKRSREAMRAEVARESELVAAVSAPFDALRFQSREAAAYESTLALQEIEAMDARDMAELEEIGALV